MANVIERDNTLQIHQTLHGYSDGHRLITGSLLVKQPDAKLMLSLSDLPAPGAPVHESGYLTGYPLASTGVYALARTWPAPEMPRPGCVWTHTLLIEYADLATLADLRQLLELFRRPEKDNTSYALPLQHREASQPATVEDGELARHLLAALYGHPNDKVVAASTAPQAVADSVVLCTLESTMAAFAAFVSFLYLDGNGSIF